MATSIQVGDLDHRTPTMTPYLQTYSYGARALGTAAAVVYIAGILFVIIAISTPSPSTLPTDFLHMLQHTHYLPLAVGVPLFLIVLGGGSYLLYRAVHKRETLLGGGRGTFTDIGKHIHMIHHGWINKKNEEGEDFGYLDLSTLHNGTGCAYVYGAKTVAEHYAVAGELVTVGSLLYLIGSIAYNIVRTCVIPFYILARYLLQRCSSQEIPLAERFCLIDIPRECIRSMYFVVTAPFYTCAYLLAAWYAFINPMGGRKLVSALERDWNRDIPLPQSFWSVRGPGKDYRWEGMSKTGLVRGPTLYMAGCYQPVAVVEYKDGKLVDIQSFRTALRVAAGATVENKHSIIRIE